MFNHQKIEKKWQKIWEKEKVYEPDLKRAKSPFYNLMMFPYPSAEGLHVGNVYAFTGSDVYGRFKRMQGYNVFEPIGLDGFGIHSENYAMKIGKHPVGLAEETEKNFYRQLHSIGNGYAWKEKLETYNPQYYKWTQWVFVQMFKNGLAYRKKQAVNWCQSCKTVLSDEQAEGGKCERCGTEVIKKELEQWFFRITKYADKLLKNLDKIDWSNRVKIAQRNWIGKSEGALIKFNVECDKGNENKKSMSHVAFNHFTIDVFTTRPDTLFGATYLVLAPEHPLIKNLEFRIKNLGEVKKYISRAKRKSEQERISEAREKTGVELRGIKAINPVNKKEIPIFVADYVLDSYGTGAIMAVPAHDQRDWEFAKKFKLSVIKVINPVLISVANPAAKANAAVSELAIKGLWEGEGEMINSGKFNGMNSEKAKWEIIKLAGGKKQIQYRLRDWLISRQRYWGPPIPMVYCEHCAKSGKGERKEMPGWYSVLEKNLPVKLPFVKDFRPQGKGESPLASVKSFYETKCPICGAKAKRETDVSDTFLDSAWYYFRYPSVGEKKFSWNPEITKKWLPVNMYIGGAEHSVLHLLYSRFLTMAFNDWGLIDFEEPFTKFRAHGLLIKEGAKMSKSKGNVINPDDYVKNFGADILRMYLMFLAPFEQGGDFRDSGILGIKRFLERIYKLCQLPDVKCEKNDKLEKLLHKTVKKVTEDIETLSYNTAISALMILFNEMESFKCTNGEIKKIFLKLLAPFAPHITEEFWHSLGNKKSIHLEKWPKYDPKLIKEDNFELIIQINGRVRDKILVPAEISQKEAENIAFASEKIKVWLKEGKVKKIIFVPNKLINMVLN